jgi:hypothetical protein
MENNLLFLKHLIKNMHPDWSDAQVEMEAIRTSLNQNNDDEEGCLYCGS